MCGIVGYVGQKNAYDVVIESLKKLEYRVMTAVVWRLKLMKAFSLQRKRTHIGVREECSFCSQF